MAPDRVFRLPDIGEGTAEAELVAWHVKPGDTIEEDQPIADVMTDKATVEITAPFQGRITECHGEVGVNIAVGAPLVTFASSDATPQPADASRESAPVASMAGSPPQPGASRRSGDQVLTTPAVRQRAAQEGIDLRDVLGTGPQGRIRHGDLEAHMAREALIEERKPAPAVSVAVPSSSAEDIEEERLTGLRRRIADKMERAYRSIPHFTYVEEADISELWTIRSKLNALHDGSRPKLSLLPFLIRAMCLAVPAFPRMNATYDESRGVVRKSRAIHLGIAVQTDDGLMVPVLRDAHMLDLWELAVW